MLRRHYSGFGRNPPSIISLEVLGLHRPVVLDQALGRRRVQEDRLRGRVSPQLPLEVGDRSLAELAAVLAAVRPDMAGVQRRLVRRQALGQQRVVLLGLLLSAPSSCLWTTHVRVAHILRPTNKPRYRNLEFLQQVALVVLEDGDVEH